MFNSQPPPTPRVDIEAVQHISGVFAPTSTVKEVLIKLSTQVKLYLNLIVFLKAGTTRAKSNRRRTTDFRNCSVAQ